MALLAAACSPPAPAAFTSPTDIELSWPDDAAAGHRVEYANDPAGPWTTLRFLPAHTTTYHHPDLIPETPFYYREQPFSGPVSAETRVGAPPADASGDTPSGLRATAAPDGTVTFTWIDRSADEAGFLLEIRRPGAPDFTPVEVTDPDATTCVLSLLPGEEGAAFRLRALHYGPLSPVVHQTTGED